jgi:predicted nucleotide-binding protein (sugar kinase/HSP70/actin superfamily)
MKFFKKLNVLREENREATANSQALLEELDRTESDIDDQHKAALTQLQESKVQAVRLRDANRRNHFSEGLTKSFQGRTA